MAVSCADNRPSVRGVQEGCVLSRCCIAQPWFQQINANLGVRSVRRWQNIRAPDHVPGQGRRAVLRIFYPWVYADRV